MHIVPVWQGWEKLDNHPQLVETPNKENSSEATIRVPSEEELHILYGELSKVSKAVLLALTPGYSGDFVQDYSDYSTPLSLLYNPSCLDMKFDELLVECEVIFEGMSITEVQARNVEASTNQGSVTVKKWFRYRAGHVTASKFKAAAHTDASQPSISFHFISCLDFQQKVQFVLWHHWNTVQSELLYRSLIHAPLLSHYPVLSMMLLPSCFQSNCFGTLLV